MSTFTKKAKKLVVTVKDKVVGSVHSSDRDAPAQNERTVSGGGHEGCFDDGMQHTPLAKGHNREQDYFVEDVYIYEPAGEFYGVPNITWM